MNSKARTCGDCTQCCKTLAIKELDKPVGVWCQHCEIGKSCRIYETKPQSCSDFSCLWLQSESQMPEELKPSRSKVVLGIPVEDDRLMVWVDQTRPTAWKEGPMGRFLQAVSKTRLLVVMIGAGANAKRSLIGPDDLVKAQMNKMSGMPLETRV